MISGDIGPQPGAQTAFLATPAQIAFYGGRAGVGKSIVALLAAGMWVDRPGYAAIIFRRTAPELVGGNSVWAYSQTLYRALSGKARESPNLDWRFPSTAAIEFRHLQHEKDVHGHQGKAYNCIVFEEATHFTEAQFWYLVSRLDDRGNCGVVPHVRATCNPDPSSFVRRLIDWWIDAHGYAIPERSGVVRWFVRSDADALRWFDSEAEARAHGAAMSFTFIGAKAEDNRLGDPTYEERLSSLPLVERSRLRDGNWNIKAGAGTILKREWFVVVDEPPFPIVATCRGWDKAATEPSDANTDPDWTAGAKWHRLSDGSRYLSDMRYCRKRPAGVFEFMRKTVADDGPNIKVAVFRDPGQAGVTDYEQTVIELRKDEQGLPVSVQVVEVPVAAGLVELANQWGVIAEAGATAEAKRLAEMAEHGRAITIPKPRVYIKRAPWTDQVLSSADAFDGTDKQHDDDIAAISAAERGLGSVVVAESTIVVPSSPSLWAPKNRGRSGPW